MGIFSKLRARKTAVLRFVGIRLEGVLSLQSAIGPNILFKTKRVVLIVSVFHVRTK